MTKASLIRTTFNWGWLTGLKVLPIIVEAKQYEQFFFFVVVVVVHVFPKEKFVSISLFPFFP